MDITERIRTMTDDEVDDAFEAMLSFIPLEDVAAARAKDKEDKEGNGECSCISCRARRGGMSTEERGALRLRELKLRVLMMLNDDSFRDGVDGFVISVAKFTTPDPKALARVQKMTSDAVEPARAIVMASKVSGNGEAVLKATSSVLDETIQKVVTMPTMSREEALRVFLGEFTKFSAEQRLSEPSRGLRSVLGKLFGGE